MAAAPSAASSSWLAPRFSGGASAHLSRISSWQNQQLLDKTNLRAAADDHRLRIHHYANIDDGLRQRQGEALEPVVDQCPSALVEAAKISWLLHHTSH